MSSIYFEPNSNLSVTRRDRRVADDSIAPLAIPSLVLGLVLVGLGLVALLRLGDWAASYGPELVMAAYALYMAAAGWLVLWSAATVRSQRGQGPAGSS
ncbi:hypothetical protein [Nocardia caishijiensis]|uniref:Uncharacterized protein n=1 Tax=Nocardia caishijiensis TaxID=184756 RepID=A0ABQ6YEA9_9NOCA|nr:hypothetical protein [Nocardia caishijiensis]KAF0835745.1 hypothetical protein FNL39_11827 [Nocardia caishijiensis]